MSDDLKKRQPEDPKQINVNEPWELKYWSQKLGVTPQQLKAAVKESGPTAAAVKKKLSR
jgi:Protein of unknown function (DUF3606)